MKKLTQEQFIEKSNKIHDNKYDYSLVEYKNNYTKVEIICNKCNFIFKQKPVHHLRGVNCPNCSKNKKLNTEIFIEKVKSVHGNNYDYSLINYINNRTKIKIICNKCKNIFLITPTNFLYRKIGCSICSNNFKLNTKSFIDKSKQIHGDKYDYSLVEYKNNKTKVKIICPIHGVFEQIPTSHLLKHTHCPYCSCCKMNNELFIEKSNKIHNNKYDYSLVNYINNRIKVKIICPLHGVFEQPSNSHLSGQGCPICRESKGERKIRNYLLNNNILFEQEKTFIGCKNIKLLPFDFYLPQFNLCIEYDGELHFKAVDYFGGKEKLEYIKNNDNIKTTYCSKNNIKLLRVRYDENVLQKLNKYLEI